MTRAAQPKQITIEAPAKINWYLAIKSRRPDGYHELETGMQKLQLADILHISIAEKRGVHLSCPGSDLPADENNLAYQAAKVFFEKIGEKQGVEIILDKKIPVAAGLGGGSSDAAAVLRGLNLLFATGLNVKRLLELAKPLGADVPFLVRNYNAAWATGIGDHLEEVPPLLVDWIVLVNPGFPVSTKWVYENFALTTGGNPYILGREIEYGKQQGMFVKNAALRLFNDLESVTINRFPEIGAIKAELLADGAMGALMSGSGPTVFGLFKEKGDAVHSYESFKYRYGNNVFLTRPRTSPGEHSVSWGVVKR